MSRIQEVEKKAGIPITNKSIEAARVVEMMRDKGVMVGRDAVYQVRSGLKSGDKISSRLEMTEILRGNSAKKDLFYKHLADVGVHVRGTNQQGHLSTVNFSRGIANELDIVDADVSRSLRAMRTEMALSDARGEAIDVRDTFTEAALSYLYHYGKGYPSSKSIRDVSLLWGEGSIEDFYRACAIAMPASHSLRTWMPYEIEALQEFYDKRIGSKSPLSELDRMTLEKNISRTSIDNLVATVRSETGVPYDHVAHFTHTNALLFGQPTRPVDQTG